MKTKIIRLIVYGIVIAFGVGLCGVGWWACAKPRACIEDFDLARDAKDFKEMVKTDIYWLNAFDMDVDYLMTTRSPDKSSRYFGKLFIKVMRDNGQLAGFITYFKEKFYVGHIQLIAVNKKFRGKHYGQQLVRYAMDQLMSMGCTKIELITWVSNVWAQKIYERLGFTKVNIDNNGIITYVYTKT